MKIDGISGVTEMKSVEASSVQQPAQPVQPVHTSKSDGEPFTQELLDKSVEQANKSLQSFDKAIERSIHEKTKAVIYVLKDTRTNEVIREFPPKKIQDMIAKMWELAGLFVDEKA